MFPYALIKLNPRGGGSGGQTQGINFDIFSRAKVKFLTPGHLENVEFSPLGTAFWPKHVLAMSNSRPQGRARCQNPHPERSALKPLANGFNIWFNIYSILLNAVGRLLNDVERGMSKRFQRFIQQNLASGLVISFRSQLFSRLRHARAPF